MLRGEVFDVVFLREDVEVVFLREEVFEVVFFGRDVVEVFF